MKDMPAVITAGGTELQHDTPRLARELDSGAIVHLVQIQSGRHRGWLDSRPPPGSDPERITVWFLQRNVGKILDDVRDGEVFGIFNTRERRVLAYLFWSTPDSLARLETSLQYSYPSRTGRTIYRDIYPLNVQAEPVPPRREVLVNG